MRHINCAGPPAAWRWDINEYGSILGKTPDRKLAKRRPNTRCSYPGCQNRGRYVACLSCKETAYCKEVHQDQCYNRHYYDCVGWRQIGMVGLPGGA